MGNSQLAVRAYHHIVRTRGLSVEDLSGLLGIEVDAASTTVAELERLGLVETCSTTEGLRPVNPVVRLASLLEHSEQGLREHERELQRLKLFATAIADEYRTVREEQALTALERLTDSQGVVARLKELYAEAEHELRIFVTNRQTEASLLEAQEQDVRLIARGLRVRLVCLDSLANDRVNRDYLTGSAPREPSTDSCLPCRCG